MPKNYKEITKELVPNIRQLHELQPEAMTGFNQLAKESMKDGALSEKTKEFVALAIGITQGCDGCIGFHIKNLKRLGATKEEIAELLAVCTYMGGGPALMYSANALGAWEDF
jgi:AhpD family alkylhydroperoxidase